MTGPLAIAHPELEATLSLPNQMSGYSPFCHSEKHPPSVIPVTTGIQGRRGASLYRTHHAALHKAPDLFFQLIRPLLRNEMPHILHNDVLKAGCRFLQ